MQLEDVEKKLRLRPFRPFRVYLSDGSVYDVRHPELMMLGRRMAMIGLAHDPRRSCSTGAWTSTCFTSSAWNSSRRRSGRTGRGRGPSRSS